MTHIKRRHVPIRGHVCNICGVRMVTRSQLAGHVARVHSADCRSFWQCGKRETKSGELEAHIEQHLKERGHRCPACPLQVQFEQLRLDTHKAEALANQGPRV